MVSVISFVTGGTKSPITDTKLHIPVVTLSTQDSVKVLDQWKPRFKRTNNWSKY